MFLGAFKGDSVVHVYNRIDPVDDFGDSTVRINN